MKILIYSLNFAPELVGCAKYNSEMTAFLAKQGHEVRVICAPPYYPQWRIQKPFSAFAYHKSDLSKNIDTDNPKAKGKVIRCPVYIPKIPTGAQRLLHLGSFAISSLPAMALMVAWKPDVVFVVAPTMAVAPTAALLAKICNSVAWLHVQDFELDAAFEIGLLKSPYLGWLARAIEKQIFSLFSIVSTISPKMLLKLKEKGVPAKRTFLFPNWVDVEKIKPTSGANVFRQRLGISSDQIVCLFSGNLGVKQGLEIVMSAARELTNYKNLKFIICGCGARRKKLEEFAQNSENFMVIDLQPPELLNELLNLADIHLLPQMGNAADLVMPSKLSGMLASGRPIVASAAPDSGIGMTLRDCGLVSTPGDVQAFVRNILALVNNEVLRKQLGTSARQYSIQNFSSKLILQSFHDKISSF